MGAVAIKEQSKDNTKDLSKDGGEEPCVFFELEGEQHILQRTMDTLPEARPITPWQIFSF